MRRDHAALFVVFLAGILALHTAVSASISDDTLGRPSSIGTVSTVSNITAGHVSTDETGAGFIGSQTLEVGTSTRGAMGALTSGTKAVEVCVSAATNYGPSTVPTGTGYAVLAANSRTVWNVSTTTPAIYFIGQAASSTVHVLHRK